MMLTDHPSQFSRWFSKFTSTVTKTAGSAAAFIIAFLIIIIWGFTGPLFHFSDTWQLVINTGTTIITFLMVFIIQQSANRDTMALHLKLNELIAANKNASNRVVSVEDLTPKELAVLKDFYTNLSALSEKDSDLFSTHSVDEARENQEEKIEMMESERKVK